MQCGVRFSAKPSSDLRLMLAQWMGCQRSIYNAKCDEAHYFRTFARKSLQHAGQYAPQDQAYAQFKNRELTPWLYDVPSEILRNGAVRYDRGVTKPFASSYHAVFDFSPAQQAHLAKLDQRRKKVRAPHGAVQEGI